MSLSLSPNVDLDGDVSVDLRVDAARADAHVNAHVAVDDNAAANVYDNNDHVNVKSVSFQSPSGAARRIRR